MIITDSSSFLAFLFALVFSLAFGKAEAQMHSPAQPPFFGVTVQHFKGDVIRGVPHLPTKRTLKLTVLSVYPQPTPEGLYVGVDPTQLLPLFQNNPAETLNRVSQHFMNVIQNAYFKIASDRGLLKMGSPFQKELENKEPFWDGRSSAIAVFEGDDFTHPLATFRVSYATPQHPELPLETRLGLHLTTYRPESAPQDLPEAQVDSKLGMNFTDRAVVENLSEAWKGGNSAGSAFFGMLVQQLMPGISTAHNYLLPDGRMVPFGRMLGAVKIQAQREGKQHALLVGGRPAEIKGLSHAQTEQHTDYLNFLFKQSIQKGFFDIIPHINGYSIPTRIAAETPAEYVHNQYANWPWQVLHQLPDATFGGEVAVVEFGREDFGKLLPVLFSRSMSGTLPAGRGNSNLNNENFQAMLSRSEAETLVVDPTAPLYQLNPQDIEENSCVNDFRN